MGIAALALNLRPAIVAVGPLTEQLRADTELTAATTSLLTTIPVICFSVFACIAPMLGSRWGEERALVAALALLAIGCGVRLLTPTAALFVGTAVVGTGIALMNVLLPALIKREFAIHTGLVMSIHAVMLNGGATLAAAVTVPLGAAMHTDWRMTLGLWGALAIAALLCWAPRAAIKPLRETQSPARALGLLRSPLAWSVAGFMGLQSLLYYSLIAWLPSLLGDHLIAESKAGLLLASLSGAGLFASFVVPLIAARLPNQRSMVVAIAGSILVGLCGLLVAPTQATLIWTLSLGLGTGAGISLAMSFFVLRTQSASAAAALSAMAQAVGYLIAACGPFMVGALHEWTTAWHVPVLAMVTATIGLMVVGWVAADARVVAPAPDATRSITNPKITDPRLGPAE